MPRTILLQTLAQAEQTVSVGFCHIEVQLRLIADLDRQGHNATDARKLLGVFQQLQKQHEARRDRLSAELGRLR